MPKTINNYANLPGDTVEGYRQAIIDTIRNYTGIDISEQQEAANTGGPAAATGIGTGTGTGTG